MPVIPAMMKLDVAVQAFDMQNISNRRFMYNPKTGILVLGQQYGKTRGLPGSHADDLAQAGIKNGFDDFVRGWVGTGKNYPAGIIHFAPNVDAQNISLFNRAFDTLEMFQRNGALPDTVVRGFGRQWEQALSEVLSLAHNERISNQEESMEIQNITVEDIRRMEDKEGLVLQGCGGDPGEWVQGINDLLAQKGILLEGTTFTHVSVFQNEGLTCLLFPFEDVKLDIGKLAMWRLQTHDTFGGTWLSDYIDNRLGHEPAQEVPEKPDCPLIGQDGNIFNLVGIASRTLKSHGMPDQAKEMADRVFSCDSYHKALCIIAFFLMFVLFSFVMFGSVENINDAAHMLGVVDSAMNKLEALENVNYIDQDGTDIKPATYDIEFKDVSFGYDSRIVLHDLNFKIPQNSTTAIVGPSGSGKSTLCNLIARFYDVGSGTITIGGTDIRRFTCDSLLKNISMVFQNVYLFRDTIKNNIKFGSPDATDEQIVAAAKAARCHDFIMALPDGYDTVIGEGGSSLSGGEKQRISIARAMLKDAPIVILDEATASIDPENEHLIQEAISALTHGKTIITIAHRLATIENADQILVIDGGTVAQRGTHRELLQQEGTYKKFIQIREQAEGWRIE